MENTSINYVNLSLIEEGEMEAGSIWSLIFISLVLLENSCCVIVLFRYNTLNENRFYALTMFQSVSNVGTCLAAIIRISLSTSENLTGFPCVLVVTFTIAMIICSLFQT